jgi:D-alanyl-D-alanine dipeptidase
MRLLSFVLLFSLATSAHGQMNTPMKNHLERLKRAQRLMVVTTPDWNSVDGTMQRYERHGKHWVKVGDAFPVVVGKNGLAWDPILLGVEKQKWSGPIKREGDGRSPAGVFQVGEVFGFSPHGPTARKYLPLTAATECVDDVSSEHYAHIVDRHDVPKVDWSSSEKMREIDVYKLGMVVNYNVGSTVKSNGSCIFLHIWKGAGRGTAGCTAMEESRLEELVQWIGTRNAVLVQLPGAEYKLNRKEWRLP